MAFKTYDEYMNYIRSINPGNTSLENTYNPHFQENMQRGASLGKALREKWDASDAAENKATNQAAGESARASYEATPALTAQDETAGTGYQGENAGYAAARIGAESGQAKDAAAKDASETASTETLDELEKKAKALEASGNFSDWENSGDNEAIKTIKSTPGYSYEYKNPEHGEGRQYGVMAQDLQKTPAGRSVVEHGNDGLVVNTPKLTMLNTAAMNEQQQQLEKLQQTVAALKASKGTDKDWERFYSE